MSGRARDTARDVIVAGLGDDERRDDGAGLEAARRLRRSVPIGVRVLVLPARTLDLLEAWSGASLAVVIDAAVSGAPPGTVHRVDGLAKAPLPRPAPRSTHGLGLADVVDLGRALGWLPARLVLLGIEVRDVSIGRGLSREVRRGVEHAVLLALGEVRGARPAPRRVSPRPEADIARQTEASRTGMLIASTPTRRGARRAEAPWARNEPGAGGILDMGTERPSGRRGPAGR